MKGNLLQGTARGRMGDIVARVVHGEQVFSKYQPVVFNQKSIAQTRQREMLSIATKKATVLNDLKAKGVHLFYANKFGASRNIRNLIVSVSTRAQRLADMGSGSLQVPYVAPVSSIGNDFDLQQLEGQVTLTGNTSSEIYAFGSEIPLDLNTKLGGFTTLSPEFSPENGDCSNISIFEADLVLTAVNVDESCLSLPKTYGVVAGGGEFPPVVTGFPYVYSFTGASWTALSETLASTGIVDPMTNSFIFLSWRDAKGNLIISKGSSKVG